MRGRGGFWGLCGALLFLLLLSALVESPADREAQEAVRGNAALFAHVALPGGAPLWEGPQEGAEAPQPARPATGGDEAYLLTPASLRCRDANGRWIRTSRYVESAYQVFRQEAACG